MNITVKKARNAAAISAGALALGGVGAAFALRRAFRPRNDFDGKVVVVTGGARGLGFALAQEFARRGAKVAINSRSESEVASARDKLAALNFPCYAAVCDITDRQQVETFLSAVRSHLGPIDVLVNNAGIIQVGPFANQKIDDFEEAMAINFWGAVYNTYAALPELSGAVLARVNKFLPDAGSDNESKFKGADSESAMTRNPITASNRIAARRLNERQSA